MTEPKDPVRIDLTPRTEQGGGSTPMRWFGWIGVGIVVVAMLIGLVAMGWALVRFIGWAGA